MGFLRIHYISLGSLLYISLPGIVELNGIQSCFVVDLCSVGISLFIIDFYGVNFSKFLGWRKSKVCICQAGTFVAVSLLNAQFY